MTAAPPTTEIEKRPVVTDNGPSGYLLDTNKFEHLWRVANAFAASKIVPVHYQGKPEDCFIAVQMAMRRGIDPFMLMQSTYPVHGRLGMLATFVIALVNSSGKFKGNIQYTLFGEGKGRSCTAWVVNKEGKRCEATVAYSLAEAEGWTKNSKWQTMTDQMLCYRAATFMARLYAPETMMGMHTTEEIEDADAPVVVESTIIDPDKPRAEQVLDQLAETPPPKPVDDPRPTQEEQPQEPPATEAISESEHLAQQLVHQLMAKGHHTAEESAKRLSSFCGSFLKKRLEDVDEADAELVSEAIASGEITVTD